MTPSHGVCALAPAQLTDVTLSIFPSFLGSIRPSRATSSDKSWRGGGGAGGKRNEW